MQAAQFFDALGCWSQHKVVSIAEDAFSACFGNPFRRHRFDRGSGANGHKRGRLETPVRCLDTSTSGLPVAGD